MSIWPNLTTGQRAVQPNVSVSAQIEPLALKPRRTGSSHAYTYLTAPSVTLANPTYTAEHLKKLLQAEKQHISDKVFINFINWFFQVGVKQDRVEPFILGTLQTPTGMQNVRMIDYNQHVAELQAITDPKHHELVGLVYPNGTLKLVGEQTDHNFWNTDRLFIDPPKLSLTGQVGYKLMVNAAKQAQTNSMLPELKSQIHNNHKITGKGIHCTIIDIDHGHANFIDQILRKEVAPDIHTHKAYTSFKTNWKSLTPKNSQAAKQLTLQQIQDEIISEFGKALNAVSNELESALQQSPKPQVINISLTLDAGLTYKTVDQLLNSPPLKALAKKTPQSVDPALATLLTKLQSKNAIASAQQIVNMVDNTLLNSPWVTQALNRYKAITKKAAKAGTTIVVAYGNQGQIVRQQVKTNPQALINWFCKSDDVIRVAGSFTNFAPWQFANHHPAAFSNQSRVYPPLVAAPAVLVPAKTSFLGFKNPVALSGTSFSSPFVAGVIALMQSANPTLTQDQIKTLLVQACENPNQFAKDRVGAGFINPIKAVNLAQQINQ
jgi:hypothetical protein